MTKRKIEYWAKNLLRPLNQAAEFVAHMKNVLETYANAYDPER